MMVIFHDLFYKLPLLHQILDFLDRKTKGAYTRAVQAIALYRQQKKVLIRWIVLSGLILFPLLACSLMAIAAGIAQPGENVDMESVQGAEFRYSENETPGASACILASYLSQTAAVIPLTPGGLGTRDAVSKEVFEASGIPAENAVLIPLIYTGIFLLISLSGALFFVFDPFSSRKHR